MAKNGDLKIVLFPDEKSDPKNYSIKWKYVYILGAVVTFLLFLFLLESITYFKMLKTVFQYNKLKAEYTILMDQVQKVNDLEKKFQEVKQYEQKLRSILGTYITFTKEDTAGISSEVLFNQPVSTIYDHIPSFIPVQGYISRDFDIELHPAVDIVAPTGTPIHAVAGGRVIFSGWNKFFGNVIVLYHGDGYFSIYKHNLRNIVEENEIVKKGEIIAYLGGTGKLASGPHLHLEIWHENLPLNPLIFLELRQN